MQGKNQAQSYKNQQTRKAQVQFDRVLLYAKGDQWREQEKLQREKHYCKYKEPGW